MQSDDLIYGSRSAIQKAIRRGDLDLARTAFEVLWPEKTHRAWLKWRMPVLIGEEAYHFAPEAAQLIKEKSDDKEEWRKLVYRLTLIRKNKDAGGLENLGKRKKIPGEENFSRQMKSEMRQMRAAYKAGGDDPGLIATGLFKELTKDPDSNGLTEYEIGGMEVMKNRVYAGGMLADRWILVGSMILMATRPCSPKIIAKEEKWGLENWLGKAGQRKPKTIELPWYSFDGHTQAGKIVLSVMMKHYSSKLKFDHQAQLWDVWFLLESGLIPPDMQLPVAMDEEQVACYQTSWWPLTLQLELERCLPNWPSVHEFVAKGWPFMQEKLEELVQWILAKREER